VPYGFPFKRLKLHDANSDFVHKKRPAGGAGQSEKLLNGFEYVDSPRWYISEIF
jgi:hypothetical protein